MELQGRVAIVTGGGTGVGAATCMRLAEAGCNVVVNYSRSADAANSVAARCREAGVDAEAHQADVSDDAQCRDLVDAAVRRFGRLDVLVNNAGTTSFVAHDDLEGMTDDAWNRIMEVNLKGPFLCTRAALPHLRADGGGEIVMTSSIGGLAGIGSSIAYCASKAGLNNLVVTLARVAGPEVRVNAVAPGFIDGDWLRDGLGDAYEAVRDMFAAQALTGRVSTSDDVAAAIVALATGSDQVTGHIMPVDGGTLHRI